MATVTEWDRALARERERFLASGTAPVRVRDEISSSWRRCSHWSVPTSYTTPPYRPEVNTDCRLLRATGPVLDAVVERLGDLDVSFIVTDADARVLERRAGSGALLRSLDAVNVSPGHLYSEDVVGTNGLGTAIELGRTTRVDGHEHYIDQLVGFTCVGVPIIDPVTRRPLGVLDVTCSSDPENKLVAVIAEQAAREVERRLFEDRSVRERALLEHFLAADRRTHSGVVVVSDRIIMSNPQAARLLDGVAQPLVWDHAARGLGRSGMGNSGTGAWGMDDVPAVGRLQLPDGRMARTRVTALRDGGEIVGALMEIRPAAGPLGAPPAPHSSARARASARAQHRPAGLVGDDRRHLEAYRLARSAVAERPVVLCGEAGVGKTALARALHVAGRLVELDAAVAALEGTAGWLDRLRAELATTAPGNRNLGASSPGTLILRHVSAAPAGVARTLPGTLDTAMRLGWRCIATATRAGEDGLLLPELDAVAVTLPPLRNRISDLPQLVAAFAAPRRIAPEAVQLLMRLAWPGNLRELRSVVRQMLAAAEQDTPGIAHIPAEVRRAAPRRLLTRFEQAEVNTILEALTETGGNKKDAALLLGISRSTLYRKLQAAGVDLDNTVY